MKPISASDILRRSAPRETLGQSFVHRNKFQELRESSPAPARRGRVNSTASQKRKKSECEESEDDLNAGSAKVSRMEEDRMMEMIFTESKISKVSTLCGRLYTEVQKQQVEVSDPVRSLLSEMIEALKVVNEVQGELMEMVKRSNLQGVGSNVNKVVDLSDSEYPALLKSR